MKVLLLGATGGTGREIVKRASAKGHSVVAVVRSMAKAGDLAGATLVQGDARDEALLARALEGCTGVISSIGTSVSPFKDVTLLSTVTRSLVKAMTRKGVRRLVCITGLGAGDSRGHGQGASRYGPVGHPRRIDCAGRCGAVRGGSADRRPLASPRSPDQGIVRSIACAGQSSGKLPASSRRCVPLSLVVTGANVPTKAISSSLVV